MKREYVEIGGVKWATMNVGAEKETDIGLYFQYGAKQGYPCPTNLCKFNEMPTESCDSVKVYLGNKWKMPTLEDFDALLRNTTNEWVKNYKDSGVNGILLTDIIDASKKLFFPACGFCGYDSVNSTGYCGYYWSSSLYDNNVVSSAWYLSFSDGYVGIHKYYRYYGFCVRGVLADK